MKKFIYLAVCLSALNLTAVFGQPVTLEISNSQQPVSKPALTKFNLDFPGGTPKELVVAIEKATGRPLNAIIPDEDATTSLPPLKMSDVVTPQLFAALKAASQKTVAYLVGFGNNYSQMTTDYGFTTSDSPLTDASIWYFHADKPSLPPMISTEKTCKFYSLEPYLNRGFTVDDITTAIQTGWKMAGITSPPELNYHKETKLLIAFGEPDELQTIDNVLNTLPEDQNYHVLRGQINQLQQEVEQLKKKIAAQSSPSDSSPKEKSGK